MPVVSRPGSPFPLCIDPIPLVEYFRQRVQDAERNGTLKPLPGPPDGAEGAKLYSIQERGKVGATREVCVVNGRLYLKERVVYPGAKPKWFDAGPVAPPLP